MMDRRAAMVLLALLLGAACEGPSEAVAPSAVLPESGPVAHASRDWDEELRAERLVAATQPR